jgi:predicted ATPase
MRFTRLLSDGTLRLLGLLWVLSAGASPLLLEVPEMSLHAAAVGSRATAP